jgi:hypothetical protein
VSPKDRSSFGSAGLTVNDLAKIIGWVAAIVVATYATLHFLFPRQLEPMQVATIAQSHESSAQAQANAYHALQEIEGLKAKVRALECVDIGLRAQLDTDLTLTPAARPADRMFARANAARWALQSAKCPAQPVQPP